MMKKLFLICIFSFISVVSISMAFAAKNELLHGNNIIDDIEAETRELVIGDQVYAVSKNVAVHSMFVKDDYFSRLKVGMKVRFTYRYNKQVKKKIINEIWVLKSY